MLCSIGIIAYFCGVQTGMAMRLHIFNIGIVRSVCFILVSENLGNFRESTRMAQSVPTSVSGVGLLSIHSCTFGFS